MPGERGGGAGVPAVQRGLAAAALRGGSRGAHPHPGEHGGRGAEGAGGGCVADAAAEQGDAGGGLGAGTGGAGLRGPGVVVRWACSMLNVGHGGERNTGLT
ncbi:hypothetical protein GCM10027440_32210 [Nocardiopsis coralliicola]